MLLSLAAANLMDQVLPGVAMIGMDYQGGGAACIIGPDLLLTNNHVCQSSELHVQFEGKFEGIAGEVIERNESLDLALIRCSTGNRAALERARPGSTRPGELVFAVGHPLGHPYVVTGGVVSSLDLFKTDQREITIVRSDAQLLPGNSGGPLINAAGQIIGINTMVFGGDQGLAISVDHAAELRTIAALNLEPAKV